MRFKLSTLLGLALVAALLAFPIKHILSSANLASANNTADIASAKTTSNENDDDMQFGTMRVNSIKKNAPGTLRYGVLRPIGKPQADILFVHGHGDRLDNHLALYRMWQQAGYRVIALDWPSHGKSNIGPLDIYETKDLIGLMQLVDRATVEDVARPLFIAGWSYGGLIATRLLQQADLWKDFSRPPQGGILLAPGIVVQPFVGGDGIARIETLNHAPYPQLAAPPSPASPLQNPLFAARVLSTAWTADHADLSKKIPYIVIVAGDHDDWYVNTLGVKKWAQRQQKNDVDLTLFQCPGARHALDNEPYPIGVTVQTLTTLFVKATLNKHAISTDDLPQQLPDQTTCLVQ